MLKQKVNKKVEAVIPIKTNLKNKKYFKQQVLSEYEEEKHNSNMQYKNRGMGN